jgi:hypothetical protein
MIRYDLVCSDGHEFDGWFRSIGDFETQSVRGFVTCAVCGSNRVDRALMAPRVLTSRSRAVVVEQDTASAPAAAEPAPSGVPAIAAGVGPMAIAPDPQQRAMLEALVDLKRKITASADYVGDRFAEEARKIHYGEAEERGIYGKTTLDEARSLLDEGIAVQPLPILPDDLN